MKHEERFKYHVQQVYRECSQAILSSRKNIKGIQVDEQSQNTIFQTKA